MRLLTSDKCGTLFESFLSSFNKSWCANLLVTHLARRWYSFFPSSIDRQGPTVVGKITNRYRGKSDEIWISHAYKFITELSLILWSILFFFSVSQFQRFWNNYWSLVATVVIFLLLSWALIGKCVRGLIESYRRYQYRLELIVAKFRPLEWPLVQNCCTCL